MSRAITIAGGFYREKCRLPPSDEFWGSGGRAAASIADLCVDTTLVTVADASAELVLASIAETVGFKYSVTRSSETIGFQYDHGLSTPVIWPPPRSIKSLTLRVTGDCVLHFGMLEANVEVAASRVIYDPQDPISPRHLNSIDPPDHLAYIANASEALKLGHSSDIEKAGRNIASESRANTVVIKRGALGLLVIEDGEIQHLPAFETRSVWPIGSGDVFGGIFAALWGVDGLSGMDAAESASRATAEYVETRVLPIPRQVVRDLGSRTPVSLSGRALPSEDFDVYLAAPFFNMQQCWLVDEARVALKAMGLKVFSPYHDIGLGIGTDVAPKDIQALERSRAVFAVVDGVDCGTIFEVGYARAKAKPVVAFAQSTSEEALKMISGTGCEIVSDFVTAIYHVAWSAWR